jgi:hypothetical protein
VLTGDREERRGGEKKNMKEKSNNK